jgi:hypothetical protein
MIYNVNHLRIFLWDSYQGVVLLVTVAFLAFCVSGISQADNLNFERGVVVPIATLIDFDPDEPVPDPVGLKDDYQFRFVELLNSTTLRVTAAYRGERSSRDADFLIDLKQVGSLLDLDRPPRHLFTLYSGYLEDTDSECHDYWLDFQKVPNFSRTVQAFSGFISTERYEVDFDCTRLLAVADYVKEVVPNVDRVNYVEDSRSIELTTDGNTVQYLLESDGGLEIAHKGLGVVGKNYATSSRTRVVSLEIKNSFFGVFALYESKSSRLLLGPEQTSSNRGFVPRSLSIAPERKPWMAYIGPQGENGLWGISVWDINQQESEPRRIGSLATGELAYSEHRGFDHAVNWTGPESIIYLEDDELTLTHVSVKADGSTKIIGRYSFNKGDAFSSTGKVFGLPWSHELKLFRLEAISALPINQGRAIRVACVAVLSHQSEEGDGQVALPLIVDLPWDLKGSG